MNNAQREKKIRAACRRAKREGERIGTWSLCPLRALSLRANQKHLSAIHYAKTELNATPDWAWSFMSGFDGRDWTGYKNVPSAHKLGVRIRKEFVR